MGPSTKSPCCLNLNAGTNKGSTKGVNVLQKFGGICCVSFFWGAPVAREIKWGSRTTARLAHANDHHCSSLNLALGWNWEGVAKTLMFINDRIANKNY